MTLLIHLTVPNTCKAHATFRNLVTSTLVKKKAIQEENRKIVTRLWGVSTSRPLKDKLPQYKIKSMVKDKMKQDQLRIDIENARLAKKLNGMPSTLNHKQLMLDFEKNLKYKTLRAHPKAHTAKKAPQVKLPYLDSRRAFSHSLAKSSSNGELKETERVSTNLSHPPEEVDQHLEYSDSELSPNSASLSIPKPQGKYNSPSVNLTSQSLIEQRLPEKIDS